MANGEPGRPSKLTTEIIEQSVRFAGLGWSDRSIAKFLAIPHGTYAKWVERNHKDFATILARARGGLAGTLAESLLEVASGRAEAGPAQLEAARLILSRRFNDDWGRKNDPPPATDQGGGPPGSLRFPGGWTLTHDGGAAPDKADDADG